MNEMHVEETVTPQVEDVQIAEQVVESMQQNVAADEVAVPKESPKQEERVPLSALQKERKKRQELEMQLEWERQQRNAPSRPVPEEDNSRYESATKEDLMLAQQESLRVFQENLWIKENPEKYERVNDHLEEFLKQRPHLGLAIKNSPNRYEEAFTLMDALTPKQQKELKQATQQVKKEAPHSPAAVPKAAALNHAVDLMSMNDVEFSEWRRAQKRRR